jgi:hypothetical protein
MARMAEMGIKEDRKMWIGIQLAQGTEQLLALVNTVVNFVSIFHSVYLYYNSTSVILKNKRTNCHYIHNNIFKTLNSQMFQTFLVHH